MRKVSWAVVIVGATLAPMLGCGGGNDATNTGNETGDGSSSDSARGSPDTGTSEPDAIAITGDDGSSDDASEPGDAGDGAASSTGSDASADGSGATDAEADHTSTSEAGEGSTDGSTTHDATVEDASTFDATTTSEAGTVTDAATTSEAGTVTDAAPTLCPVGEQQCASDGAATYCANTGTDPANCGTCGNACPSGEVCNGGTCALGCGAQTLCSIDGGSPYCADTVTDNDNCGTCGNACPAGQACTGSACAIACGALTTCTPSVGSPYCADTVTDNANCGTCGNACGAGYACAGSVCVLACGALTTCTPDGGAAYCANTATDNNNCGTCGNTCTSGHTCTGGHCIVTCGALTTCTPDGGTPYCANTSTDNDNCGTCGNTCASGDVCGGGGCALTCGSLTTCTTDAGVGYCANTSTDQSNCGTCGNKCASGYACAGGNCTASCSAGQQVCGNSCTNTTYDPNNCGSCGFACTYANGSGACSSSTCSLASCTAGYGNCDGLAANGCETNVETSATNCGACGHACDLGETCQSGTCTFTYSTGLLGYWAFNDTPGSTTAADSSGNNLTGQLIGGVAIVAGEGKQGTGGATFTGGYVDVAFPNDAANQGSGVYMPQGNVTYAMWFKTSVSGSPVEGLQVVWGESFTQPGGSSKTGYDRVIGNGSVGFLNYNVWSEINPVGTTTVNDGNWHQVVYVLDETYGLRAYVDGAVDMTDPGATTSNCGLGCSGFNWASDYLIGTGMNGRFGALAFNGIMDEVRIYNFALSASEITALYNATK